MQKFWLVMATAFLSCAAPVWAAPEESQPEVSPAAKAAVDRAQKAKDKTPAAMVSTATPVQPSPEDVWLLDLSTGGRVRIVLRPDVAPEHAKRIRTLTRQGFYDGLLFHRVIEGFMAQGGDPTGTGTGSSKLPNLQPEFNDLPHVRGALSMARAEQKDSANSQFFIVTQPTLKLDHQYTVFGRVTDGMEWVDAIEKGEPPVNPSSILQASMAADNKAAPAPRTPIPAALLLNTPSLFPAPPKP